MSYYDILEVSPKASKEVIKNAYRALSKKYHPDTYKGDLKYAQEKMKEINTAYETLMDEEKRLVYDYENGYKIEGFFDENLIKLQQNYIEKLLNYKNKYTATTIGKDPVVAMIEYMDSNSMFLLSSNPRSEYGISADLYGIGISVKYSHVSMSDDFNITWEP